MPHAKSLQYSLIDALILYDEEKHHMLEFTKRLTMLLVTGPHDKKFAEGGTDTIYKWFWDVLSDGEESTDSGKSEDEIRNEAEGLLSALDF